MSTQDEMGPRAGEERLTERAPVHDETAQPKRQRPAYRGSYRSPSLAGFLSCMPGLGQIYVGYYQHGFIYVAVVAFIITALASGVGSLEPLLGFFLSFFWLYNIIDAVRRAKLYNQILEDGEIVELPEGFKMPGMAGSLAGGIVLIVMGGLIFLHTKFDVSMEWLEEWWPLAVLGLGVYLVVKAVRSKRAEEEETVEIQ